MSSFFKKLFNSTPQSPDGLTQPQREAMVDVLFYCMYADNSLALKEEKILADTVGQFAWDPKISYDAYAARSIATARSVKESPATRVDFLASVAHRLGTPAVKLRTLGLCRQIFQADGDVSSGEQELLRELERALS
jgi:uncharacterized tellurite resistance protein B-like protein